jgi:uncharacterized damage-inducible protein DinB
MASTEQLARDYLAGADMLRKAVQGMTPEQLVARPIPGRWSTLEVVAHLADFDLIMADRIKRIIALGDIPLLLNADENLFQKNLAYQERDLEEELLLIESIRKQTGRIIKALRTEQLESIGVHNKRGLITLEKVIQLAINHISHHVAFINEKRKALGLPVV